jgi:hypothetical protein
MEENGSESSSDAKFAGSGKVLAAAIVLSLVVFAVGIGFTLLPDTGDTCSYQWRLLCLKPGDFGSFLSGVFSTIAFIWVASAVFVQSQELKQQREELRLTREEVVHNREVMKAQVLEARNQAELLGQQTELLINTAAEATADGKLQAHISVVATRLRHYNHAWVFQPQAPGSNKGDEMRGNAFAIHKAPSAEDNDYSAVASIAKAARTQRRRTEEYFANDLLVAQHPYDFMRMFTAVRECLGATSELPEVSQIKARASEIDSLFQTMNYLIERASNLPAREDA